MKEFQAENDRHQTMVENNFRTSIDATTDQGNLNDQSSIPDKQQRLSDNDLNQLKINSNTSESRTNIDRNKLNMKPSSRLTCDTLAVRLDFIFQVSSSIIYSRHQDVRHMVVYPIFMYELSKVIR
jgi:hypothetical protein